MDKIKIKIDGRVAEIESAPEVVTDNAEYEVEFAVDERDGWNPAVPMTALFVRRDARYTAVVMDVGETICTMPPQTGTNVLYIGLTQEEMRTTTPAAIKVYRSIRTVANDPLPAPTEDVYAQILAAYAGIKILSGKGAPTSATQGAVNQLYRDEDTQKLYICTATDGGYTWAAVSGGSVDVDETLTKAGYAADAKAAGDAIEKKIDAPQVAQVGEVLTVEEVYADGKPKKWKTQMIDAGYDTILAAIDQAVFDKQLLVDILAGTCENLTGDAITAIADYVFYMKQSLKTIDLPNCVSVGNNAFYGCGALTAVDLPMVTSIGNYAFCICTALTTVDLPMATSIGNSMLYGCTALTTVDLPMATSIGDFTFRDCTALTNVNLPVATSIARNAFQSCIALTSINLPMVTSIGNYTFFRCFSLTALVLSGTNVCTLANENAFGNCYHILGTTDSIYNPTGAKDGYIYVPDDLVDSYKSATNWTTYASQIKPLSEFAGVA